MVKSGKMADMSVADGQKNFKKAIEKGVLKILSKMGISLLSCYHGAQIFEIYGLGDEVVDLAFRGSVSRIGGLSIDDLQREAESFWIKVFTHTPSLSPQTSPFRYFTLWLYLCWISYSFFCTVGNHSLIHWSDAMCCNSNLLIGGQVSCQP